MKHNPAHFKWADRDRFVLSNGHASALLYSSLFLSGYKVTLDDLKSFGSGIRRRRGIRSRGDRRRGSDDRAAGSGHSAMAVGHGDGGEASGAVYNKPGFEVVDHHTYVLCGDGDLMEGVSHEAASLAGRWGWAS
jgi:transketolase